MKKATLKAMIVNNKNKMRRKQMLSMFKRQLMKKAKVKVMIALKNKMSDQCIMVIYQYLQLYSCWLHVLKFQVSSLNRNTKREMTIQITHSAKSWIDFSHLIRSIGPTTCVILVASRKLLKKQRPFREIHLKTPC